VGLLFVLMWTSWQVLIGFREVREFGIIARFGGILFQIFVLVQLTLMLFFAPLAAATAVAHEKDRRTFVLLLMTDLSDTEIVLGKLAASLLQIGTFLATAMPVFFLCMLLGGVSPGQILDVLGVTAAAGLAGGALGLLVALGRDRTFQSLALTVLLMVLLLAGVEALGFALPGARLLGVPLASALNPYRAVFEVIDPTHGTPGELARPSLIFSAIALGLAVALLVFGVFMLRVWNPGRNEPREQREGEGEAETIETLIEVDEVDEPALVGAAVVEDAREGFAEARSAPAEGPFGPGAGRGDHRPARAAADPSAHRRGRQAIPPSLEQSHPLARAEDPRLRDQAVDHQGGLCPGLRPGGRLLLPQSRLRDEPVGWDPRADPAPPGRAQPRARQRAGRDGADQRAR
jgi:ABC-type transport system involved in multi-copper enzyme maturation permease subunit